MKDLTNLAARLRHCHAQAFGLNKLDWMHARDCDRVRWMLVAERYQRAVDASIIRAMGCSGRLLYLAWSDGYGVPWSRLALEKRLSWMAAARQAHAWGSPERSAA